MAHYYSPSEAASQLNIQPSTIRKYSQIMEESGYEFMKGENGKRYYRDEDVMLLKRIVSSKNSSAMPLKSLIHSIVGETNSEVVVVNDTPLPRYGNDILALLEGLKGDLNGVQEVKQEIVLQNERLKKKEQKRDEQMQTMMKMLQESQEEIRKLNEKIEEAAADQPAGFFSKLFRRS